jgi:hypothetical protein
MSSDWSPDWSALTKALPWILPEWMPPWRRFFPCVKLNSGFLAGFVTIRNRKRAEMSGNERKIAKAALSQHS